MELPVVARRPQRQLEHPERRAVHDLGVRDRADRVVVLSAGPDDELPDPASRVRIADRVLRSKALVVVRMT